MYQSQVLVQNTPKLYTSVAPQNITQSYVVQPPQILTNPQTIATTSLAPQIPQIVMTPQVQSVVPQIQTVIPQAQSVVPPITSYVPTGPQAPMVSPFILPKGSRMPLIMNHQGQIPPMMNFNNIGGCPYGRISMIK